MNNWQSIPNEALNATGWHLWQRHDKYGVVYQMTSNKELTPKSAAGFLTVESLFNTYGIKHTIAGDKPASSSATIH